MQYWMKKHLFIIIIVLVFIIFFIFSRESIETVDGGENSLTSKIEDEVDEIETGVIQTADKEKEELIFVDVKGAIQRPGVYEVKRNDRVIDVIRLAGGFTDDADEKQINLAQKVEDEMVIIVARVGEELSEAFYHPFNNNNNAQGIKINQATKEEIETLKGIGPSKAQAIINYRDEHGPFKTFEDLLKVSGIGEKTLENIKDDIIIP